MASSSNNRNKKNNNLKVKNISVQREIVLLICLLFSILLFISNFGIGGKLTQGLSNFFFGIFGVASFIFPIIFTSIVFILVSDGRIRKVPSKITVAVLITIIISMTAQLIDSHNSSNYSLLELFKYAMRTHKGGGFLGAALYKLFNPAIGTPGIIILIIFLVIICGVLVTGKSFLNAVFSKGSEIAEDTKKRIEDNHNQRDTDESKLKKQRKKNREFKMPVIDEQITESAEEPKEKTPLSEDNNNQLFYDFDNNAKTASYSSNESEVSVLSKENKIRKRKSKTVGYADSQEDALALKYSTDTDINIETADNEPEKRTVKKRAGVEELTESDFNNINNDSPFMLPSIKFFTKNKYSSSGINEQTLRETSLNLQSTLKSFGVNVNITDVSCGPAVTRYEFRPEPGVKVNKILSLADDIKLNLAVSDIRIEAPVPGKAAVGIEVPNAKTVPVLIRDLLESEELMNAKSTLAFAAGKDVSGKVIVADLAKMPHMLIAGTTGSGKSVFTNSILMTFLYRCKPQDVRFIIIDPKVVEFGVYNGIPNLIIPVVTDPKKAAGALNWAVAEMTDRYKKFADMHVRDLESYNKAVDEKQYEMSIEEGDEVPVKLPRIVIIIDELADLMMVAAKEVEEAICRLAQLARAAGIHMIIATQRPSVDVITGLIKANIPSRVALTVASGTDSRTILDMNGAEKLLGHGDMLFYPSDYPKPLRVQGSFVSDSEIASVVNFLKTQSDKPEYDENVIKIINNATETASVAEQSNGDGRDELFLEAGRLICDKQKASIGSLQRCFRIGFNRAARIMDQLCEANVVGPEQGTKPREILMTLEEFEQLHSNFEEAEEEID